MATNRIFYAVQAIGIDPVDTGAYNASNIQWLHGVQSVGITTNFNLEQAFELGQLAIYENIESVPEIEVTVERVLDGWTPAYLVACPSGANNIVEASNNTAGIYLVIYPDDRTAASGTGSNGYIYCSGMRPSSVSYTFPVEGNSTESITFVGNDKVWDRTAGNLITPYSGIYETTSGDAPSGYSITTGGIFRRQHFDATGVQTVIPQDVKNATNGVVSKIQNITASVDIGRENIFELGAFRPYTKYATFPVTTTCDFEVVSTSGDRVSASGNSSRNLADREIKLNFNNGKTALTIDFGKRNKLSSVNYTGGDTGGGNASMTFSYQGFNAFKVTHSGV
jgi:hypothetical protein